MIKKIFFILLTLLVTIFPIFGKTQDVDILKSRNIKSATMNGKKYHYDIENSIYIGKFNGVQSYIAFIKPQNKPNKTFVGYFKPISGDKIINAYNGLLSAFKDNENFIQMNDARWISSYTDIDFNCHILNERYIAEFKYIDEEVHSIDEIKEMSDIEWLAYNIYIGIPKEDRGKIWFEIIYSYPGYIIGINYQHRKKKL